MQTDERQKHQQQAPGDSTANDGKYQRERNQRKQEAMRELEQDIDGSDSVVSF